MFKCPCGCGDRVELNILQDCWPCWRYSEQETGLMSIYPSVWLIHDCGAHFSVHGSSIKWHWGVNRHSSGFQHCQESD
ncbi:DUF6527 family protein [Pontiella desulfatans]|uniref:DUF6527 family protein n=1 Tax=Pontiella desulfatans TaxID=2750659 RepID=UPI0038B366D5